MVEMKNNGLWLGSRIVMHLFETSNSKLLQICVSSHLFFMLLSLLSLVLSFNLQTSQISHVGQSLGCRMPSSERYWCVLSVHLGDGTIQY